MKRSIQLTLAAMLTLSIVVTFWADDKRPGVPPKPVLPKDNPADKDKKGKTTINSKMLDWDFTSNEAVYEGEVVLVNDDIDLFTDKMTVYFADKKKAAAKEKPKAVQPKVIQGGARPAPKQPAATGAVAPMAGIGGDIDQIVCEGNVIIVNKKDKSVATGNKAVYTKKAEMIVITGNGKLRKGGRILLGKEIHYHRITGRLRAIQPTVIDEGKPDPEEPKKPSPKPNGQ